MTNQSKELSFQNGQEINHPKYGKGKVVGYVNGGSEVRIQFATEVRDFNPINLQLVLKNNSK